MNEIDIFKALANETRLNILKWLKHPEDNFPPQGLHIPEGDSFDNSACVGSICDKAKISQSTISSYLDMLQRAGRNEDTIQKLSKFIQTEL